MTNDMKIFKLIVLLAFLSTQTLFAFDLDINRWSDYSGKLNDKEIRVSLYRFNNNQVRGHYYYTGTDNKIYLAGKIKGVEISLWAIVNKQAQSIL